MATQVIMPKLGLTMTKGKVVKWLVAEGAEVAKGQPIVEITTEKIANVVEAPADGLLRKVIVPPGATVPVLAPLAIVGAAGEDIADLVARATAAVNASVSATPPAGAVPTAAPAPVPVPVVRGAPAPEARTEGAKASPKAARLAEEAGLDLSAVVGSGPGGRILVEDVEKAIAARDAVPAGPPDAAPPDAARVKASPAARRLAGEKGIDLGTIQGTGPEGRILSEDVERAAAARVAGGRAPQLPAPPGTPPADRPASGPADEVRLTIAGRMMDSLHGTAQLTITRAVNAGELVRLRQALLPRIERERGVRLTYTDLVVRAAALALREHPWVNVSFDGVNIIVHQEINIGVAVDLDRGGLIVPVLRGADRLGLADIAAGVRDLVDRARRGALTADDVTGGTFTVSNPGMLGVDAFTPIINPPESAILGVGRIVNRPVVAGGQVVPGQEMVLSLTHDHRVIDGGPAARFLAGIARYLEEPYSLLSLGGA